MQPPFETLPSQKPGKRSTNNIKKLFHNLYLRLTRASEIDVDTDVNVNVDDGDIDDDDELDIALKPRPGTVLSPTAVMIAVSRPEALTPSHPSWCS
jgi:hypothetical protein